MLEIPVIGVVQAGAVGAVPVCAAVGRSRSELTEDDRTVLDTVEITLEPTDR